MLCKLDCPTSKILEVSM
uniref:Uncharacterized protein n=1 Tax=Arundo donax TaxID=35708 RepID=A0A0A9B091_ARUDO